MHAFLYVFFKRWKGGGGGGFRRVHKRIPIFSIAMFHNTALPNPLWSFPPSPSLDDGSLYTYVRCYSAEGYHNLTETGNSIQDVESI